MLSKLQKLWSADIVLDPAEVSSVVETVAKDGTDVYVRYCSNAQYQERVLQQLK